MNKLAQWLKENYPDFKPGDGTREPHKPTPKKHRAHYWDYDEHFPNMMSARSPVIGPDGFCHGYHNKGGGTSDGSE